MSRRKQKTTLALIMDVFLDGPLAVAETALEMAQELMARRRTGLGTSTLVYTTAPPKRTTKQPLPTATARVDWSDGSTEGTKPIEQVVPAAALAPKPIGVRRRRVATTEPVVTAVIAPKKRGRPFSKKATAAVPPETPATPPEYRDLPDQLTPDDYDIVEQG